MNYQRNITIEAGQSEVLVLPKDLDTLPISLQLSPGNGGSVSAQVSCDSQETLENNQIEAVWTDLASVSSSTIVKIETPVSAIKITATTAEASANVRTFRMKVSSWTI